MIRTNDHGDGMMTLVIERPEALNALNFALLEELNGVLARLESDASVRGLIVTGHGEKAFVAGADISEFKSIEGQEAARKFAERGQGIFARLEALPFCTIAAVNGFALGGGLELALSCDFILASENAKMGLPEVGLGIIPGYGGTQRLTRALGPHAAKRIALSGEMFTAATLKEFGLVLEVVPQVQLLPRALEVLRVIGAKSPQAVAAAKMCIDQTFKSTVQAGFEFEAMAFGRTFETPNRKEGVQAFLEKRKPQFK